MTRADTIARHLFAFETHLRTVASGVDVETRTSAVPDAVAALREAFAVLDGGALPGVAWEAARAGEEAERLRTELAAVKAERDKVLSNAAVLDTSLRRLRADRDAFKARASARAETLECERDSLREHLSNARAELAAVKAERDALNAAEADLRHALRQIAELVGGAVSLGASTDMHCAVANEVRVVVADLRAERDALAAEVQRGREQKPVHLALVDKQGAVVDGYLIKTRALAEDDARRRACTVAPLYLAPVVRDHSGVIAQCEEALREWDSKGAHCSATSSMVAVTLTKARNALRGAS